VFAQGKIAVSDIRIASTAVTLTALSGQYDASIRGGFQQIPVGGAFETELLPVSGREFNGVSVHVLFGLQKNAAGKVY
jgi:hypothetical protein